MTTEGEVRKGWETFDQISLSRLSVADEEGQPPKSAEEKEVVDIKDVKPVVDQNSIKDTPSGSAAILDPVSLNKEHNKPKPAQPSIISAPHNVNGKVLATVYPDNLTCDWVTPPHYDPYSMPSILAIDVPALPGEDYINVVKKIISDPRFKMFSTAYSRIIALWMVLWIFALAMTLLYQTQGGWPVMIWCLIWGVILFIGIYVCAIVRKRIRVGLNEAVAEANAMIVNRHFLIGIEDRGQLSCHKTVIHFLRFNVAECTAEIIKQLKIKKTGGCVFGTNVALEAELSGEEIEKEAAQLILDYSQEYVKSVVKKRLHFPSRPIHGVSNYMPKHCRQHLCFCQFIDDKKFNAKPKKWYERYV
ncbi:unnamed protein product [Caenorhabditis bovis]|uniref:Uncharacterized protein n=1 Tax=Caenorhabditis bovis TaxID=2654633 RepID=A0A8S1EIK7_9PELO|nr:unnamed protein product [Caenorhabditis bovis]